MAETEDRQVFCGRCRGREEDYRRLERQVKGFTNKRIEPRTRSVMLPVLESSVSGALLVTAHPQRQRKEHDTYET